MAEEEPVKEMRDDAFWKSLVAKYWWIALIFGLIIIGAIAGFFLVLDWYVNVRSPYSLGGTALIGNFSPKTGLLFMIYFFLWELLLVALPGLAAAGFMFALTWFVFLKEDEKAECKARSEKDEEKKKKRHKTGKTSGKSGGVFEFLVFIGVIIYLVVDNTWALPLSNPIMSVGYFVNVWITVNLWAFLIIGVPALTFGLLWFWKKFGKD